MKKPLKVIISGGGTGGHIFPAIAIANTIRHMQPDADILFVGANNRMEMERVPAAGYPIVGLPVKGFDRSNLFKNIEVIGCLFKSLRIARQTVRQFAPDIAIGVGGYASGPTLWAASNLGIPTLIQEQNSYAGVTNKLLAKKASTICVAYPDMERFFPKESIVMTGNPIREELLNPAITVEEARNFFKLDPAKKTILVIGGSLGARTVNQSIEGALEQLAAQNDHVQLIWQTGKAYDAQAQEVLKAKGVTNVVQMPFIARMDMAYKAADLVISRAGASSISELCLLEKPAILVPSPNVSEDHQTKNALVLERANAALLVRDSDAVAQLVPTALQLVTDEKALATMATEVGKLAFHHSAQQIAEAALKLCK